MLGSPAAFADESPNLLTDSFQVALGTFILTSEPTIQLKGDTSSGDKVDFDEALGGGDSQRIRLDSLWRFGDSGRHKIKAIAFDMSRDNSKTWDRDIEWGGDIYPVGAKVDAEFSFTVIEVAYEYAFLKRDNYELDGSIGLHYTDMSTSLKAKVETSQADAERRHQQHRERGGAVAGHRSARHLGPLAQLLAGCDRAVFRALHRRVRRQPAGLPRAGHVAAEEVAGPRPWATTGFRWTSTSTRAISTARSTGPTAAR